MDARILVIIPAYNEEKTIAQVVRNIASAAPMVDVVVINDGSRDRTSAEARRVGAPVLDLPCNLGIGGAMQTGYVYAHREGYDIAIQIDADGQHDPRFIGTLVEPILAGQSDMVIGSRYVEKTDYQGALTRRLGSWVFTGLLKVLTGLTIYDSTSGFRAVNKGIIRSFAECYPQDYPEVDVIVRLRKNGFRLLELPVEMHERKGGQSSITAFKSVYYMIKVSLSLVINSLKPRTGVTHHV